MGSRTEHSYYSTTDEFSFSVENDIIQIHFGPMRLQLTVDAAQDLSYRLESYLVFLQHQDEVVQQKMEEEVSKCYDNVLMYPGRTKNEQ